MTAEAQWIELYRRTVPELYRRLSRRTGGNRDLAEDLTQEAWLRLLAQQGSDKLPREPLAWLLTTATNLLRNHFRDARPAADVNDLELSGPSLEVTRPESAALVQWGLARLQARQAQLIEAHHLDGRSLQELAGELRLSERAVEGRLRRARLALAHVLAPHLGPRLEKHDAH